MAAAFFAAGAFAVPGALDAVDVDAAGVEAAFDAALGAVAFAAGAFDAGAFVAGVFVADALDDVAADGLADDVLAPLPADALFVLDVLAAGFFAAAIWVTSVVADTRVPARLADSGDVDAGL